MSLSIVLCSDFGVPGSLELKIACALWEAKGSNIALSPQRLNYEKNLGGGGVWAAVWLQ